jgi:antitoxin component YwqK of YwqJK toxin-antitoxin module
MQYMKIGKCLMQFVISFKNINQSPNCSIFCNNKSYYNGPVKENIEFDYHENGILLLEIAFTNKKPQDTVVDQSGNIISDKSFELEKIVIDGYDLNELIWESYYQADDGKIYNSCLFFGPPGKFIIILSNPILPWILETKHKKYNNDPNWQEDYNYYVEAKRLLTLI